MSRTPRRLLTEQAAPPDTIGERFVMWHLLDELQGDGMITEGGGGGQFERPAGLCEPVGSLFDKGATFKMLATPFDFRNDFRTEFARQKSGISKRESQRSPWLSGELRQ